MNNSSNHSLDLLNVSNLDGGTNGCERPAAARSMWFPRLSSNTCESDIREVDCAHLVREFDLSSSSDIR